MNLRLVTRDARLNGVPRGSGAWVVCGARAAGLLL